MVERKKRKKLSFSLQFSYILAVLGFALVSLLVYYFSFDSKIHVLDCQGNYYYTDKQIYEAAQVSTNNRIWLTPEFTLEKKVEELPLIKSVSIQKEGNKLTIKVKEKDVVGYYVKGNKNYVLTNTNESIELDKDYLKTIVYFPLLSNFTENQLKQITEQFKKYDDILTKEMICKIAEMVPFQSSYDDNMVKITMQDGNTVYSSMDSLAMMSNYQSMLTELKGQNVCLFLDSEHSAIDKVDCESINKPKEEKPKTEKPKDKNKDKTDQENIEDDPKGEEQNLEDPSKDSIVDDEDSQNSEQDQEDLNQPQNPEEVPSDDPYAQTQDWTVDGSFWGFEYSPSLDLYRDPYNGVYYRWNEQSQSFDTVE